MTDTNFASADAFNFDSMVEAVGIDPFAQTANKYAKDERFYTLTKDKDGNGAALIRFLPDAEKGMIQKMFKINTTITDINGKKRFMNEYTPATIGLPCPFQEEWQRLWNAGKKDESKNFGRSIVYVANIKVIKDPKNPENEGKIFLYQFSGAMNKKIESAMRPSADDIALGKVAKQVFNPLAGNSMRLVAQRGSNNQINYDNTEIVPEINGIYADVAEAVADIQANTHKLSSLIAPEAFKTYDELKVKFDWVTFADQKAPAVAVVAPVVEVAQPVVAQPEVVATPVAQPAPVAPVAQPAPVAAVAPVAAAAPSLDSLLDSLV